MTYLRAMLLILLSAACCLASNALPLWGNLTPGPYGVGFTTRSRYDYSRAFRLEVGYDGRRWVGETARPVQILVWYPASIKAGAGHFRYRDYIHLAARESSFEELTDSARQQSEAQYLGIAGSQYDRNSLLKLLDYQTAAVTDAASAEGRFPLIIYAPGSGGRAFENSILCEYLASHGYVVAAIPSTGTYMRSPTVDLVGFNTYARDIEFAIAAMHDFPNADPRNLALMGFSMGGSANTLVQMRNMNIHAAVYFDTGLPYRTFMEQQFSNDPEWDTSNLRAPQLYFIRRIPEIDPEFAKQIRFAEVYTLSAARDFFRHQDFIAEGMLAGVVPGLFPDNAAERKEWYETICRYTLNFLNGYLKKDPAGMEFLKRTPEQNGVQANLVASLYAASSTPPPYKWEMEELLRTEGVGKFREVYEEYRKDHPESPLIEEARVNAVGYNVLFQGDPAKAIDIFRMNVELYPASANARDSLSEAYETAGKKEESLQNARKALELLPSDSTLNDQRRDNLRRVLEGRIKRLTGSASSPAATGGSE